MDNFMLSLIDIASHSFPEVQARILEIVLFFYIFYGVVLAIDAYRRFRFRFTPIVVFLLWLVFSLLFLPVYLMLRPDLGTKQKPDEASQHKALLIGSGLDICPNCHNITERFYRHCQSCGQELVKYCTDCHEPAAVGWTHCVKCGKVFPEMLLPEPKPNGAQKAFKALTGKLKPAVKLSSTESL